MSIRVCCRAAFCLALGLAGAGCGVVDYEHKMANSQARVARWEEMSRLLDGPVTPPVTMEDKYPKRVANVFFRPPKGISPSCSNEKEPRARVMYTYPAVRPGAAG